MHCFLNRQRKVGLDGLSLTENGLEIVKDQLLCCGGSGYIELEDLSQKRCTLKHRLALVTNIYKKFFHLHPEHIGRLTPEKLKLHTPTTNQILSRLKQEPHAWMQYITPTKKLSDFWASALIACWHTGIRCDVIDVTQMRSYTPPTNEKSALFITRLQKLHVPDDAQEFERIVSTAYNANIYLFCEVFYNQQTSDSKPSFNQKFFFKEKLGYLKNKHPLTYLSGSTRSRIQKMEIR